MNKEIVEMAIAGSYGLVIKKFILNDARNLLIKF